MVGRGGSRRWCPSSAVRPSVRACRAPRAFPRCPGSGRPGRRSRWSASGVHAALRAASTRPGVSPHVARHRRCTCTCTREGPARTRTHTTHAPNPSARSTAGAGIRLCCLPRRWGGCKPARSAGCPPNAPASPLMPQHPRPKYSSISLNAPASPSKCSSIPPNTPASPQNAPASPQIQSPDAAIPSPTHCPTCTWDREAPDRLSSPLRLGLSQPNWGGMG